MQRLHDAAAISSIPPRSPGAYVQRTYGGRALYPRGQAPLVPYEAGVLQMNGALERKIDRRVLVRAATVGVGATIVSTLPSEQAPAKPVDMNDKRGPRYKANSVEVRNFYRVNRYPNR
jgi:hypothetical protein